MTFSSLLNRQSLPLLAAFYIFFATIPLVWVRLLGTSIAPYHVMAFVLLALLPILPGASNSIVKVLQSGRVVWLALATLIVAMLVSYTRPVAVFQPFFFFKFTAFAATSFVSAVFLNLLINARAFGALAFVPLTSSLMFVVFISLQFSAANIDPFALLSLAISRADPNIVMNQVFRAAFSAANEDLNLRSNLKQTLSFAFIIMIPLGVLSLKFMRTSSPLLKLLVWVGILIAVVMTILPFSRAAWLSLFLVVCCLLVPFMRSSQGLLGVLLLFFVAVPLVMVIGSNSDFFSLIDARLSSTDSLDGRLSSGGQHWEAIGQSPWFGVDQVLDKWAHNVIIDAWSAFGILGLIPALVVFVVIAATIAKGVVLAITAPREQRIVHASIAAFLCPYLVRMLTAPNVTVDFPVWVAMGFAYGLASDVWLKTERPLFKPERRDVAQPVAV